MMKQSSIKQIARQRIEILFEQAKLVVKANPKLAAQYIGSARRIAMAAKIRLPYRVSTRNLQGLQCAVCAWG